MLHDVINKMIDLAAEAEFSDEIMAGNQEYFAKTGRVVEEEPTYETRMSLFLEWFIFERPLTKFGVTPLLYFGQNQNGFFSAEEMKAIQEMQSFQHSIYEFTRVKESTVFVRDLLSRKKIEVFERRGTTGFFKEAVFEARLVPYQGAWHFSGAILFHPPRSKKFIRKFLKNENASTHLERMLQLEEICLKYERYRHVDPEKIYTMSLETMQNKS